MSTMMVADDLDVDQLIDLLAKEQYVALDTESTGQDVRDGRGFGIGLSLAGIHCNILLHSYVPIRHSHGGNVDHSEFQRLKKAIEEYDGYLIFHNAKFDLVSLETMGIKYQGKFYDTMLMAHLVNENLPYEKSLNACVKMYVGEDQSKKNEGAFQEAVKAFGWDMPVAFMKEYASWDAALTIQLFNALFEEFKDNVSWDYWEHKQKFVRVIIEMERQGILIDTKKCEDMIAIGESNMQDVIDALGGLNPGSSKDLEELLINTMKLPVVKSSEKTGKPSFDKFAMQAYEEMLEAKNDDTAEQILAYRGWQKTVSSNYRAYLGLLSPDGRLRPNYKLHGTKTGRLSCEKPNLQQIPKESAKEWNGDLKETFIPTPGYKLYEADYSQLELRLATAYAKEDSLKRVFAEGRDIFTEMSRGLGMSRQDTKTLVYSIQYGGGINRIVNIFGVTPGRAAEIRDNFFNTYLGFKRVSNMAKNKCLVEGRVRIWSGRFRHFRFRRDEAHKAFNSVMQGGAADIVEKTMVKLHEQVVDENCRMLLQVHDSVWFEIKEGMEEEYFPKIEEIMTNVENGDFGVKFAIDIHKIGA